MVARDFVKNFTKLEMEMDNIYKRDKELRKTIDGIVYFIQNDYTSLHSSITNIQKSFDKYAKDIVSWTTENLMFVNEVRGYNLSLRAYNDRFDNMSITLDSVLSDLNKIKENKQ